MTQFLIALAREPLFLAALANVALFAVAATKGKVALHFHVDIEIKRREEVPPPELAVLTEALRKPPP